MSESIETNIQTEESELIESIRGELNTLSLDIKKESFRAKQELKNKVKSLGFYNGDESGENIRFDISKVKKYLESIKNKSRSDLDVKSSELEKGVRTIAIQIAINYINMNNGYATNNIDWIDGIRGNQTWKGVKQFQTNYGLINKDGLPGHETITKILELLPDNSGEGNQNNSEGENEKGDNQNNNSTENNTGEIEGSGEGDSFIESRLNHSDIDNSKCVNLLQNLKIYGNNGGYDLVNTHWNDLENQLQNRLINDEGLESIVLQNKEIWNLLGVIVLNQSEEIEKNRWRYLWKKKKEDTNRPKDESDQKSDENNISPAQSWEDYKFENASLDSFEEFILSNDGIAIIIDEIKSHIDTSHESNGQYDRFYAAYPFSIKNLEKRLRNAWEDRIRQNYRNINYLDDELEKLEKLGVMSHNITKYIDNIVGNHRKSGKEMFSQDIIMNLEGFISKGFYGAGLIEMFSGEDSKNFRDTFQELLSSRIKGYEDDVRNKKDEFILDTGDKQIDLQLKSYLYLYGRIFYPKIFVSGRDVKYYEDILPEIMKSILSNDDESLKSKIKNREFLIAEMKLEEDRKKRDLKRRQEAAKRIKERNERLQSIPKTDIQGNILEIQTNTINPNDASGPELAAEADLGKELDNYNLDIEESEERKHWKKETAFREAWKEFIQSHDNIKSIITEEQMRRIFDINNNTIINSELQKFIKLNPLIQDMSDDDLEKISNTLSKFTNYFNNAEKKLSDNSSETKEKINETVKTYAIGAVIDNVRDTFDLIGDVQDGEFSGFQLKNEDPIMKVGEDIIISGTFNGSEVKVRYDLKTGQLFMNSFLHRLGPNKVSLGLNSTLDYPIGTIRPFNEVLNDYYKLPPRSENNETHTSIHGQNPGGDQIPQQRPMHDGRESEDGLLGNKPIHHVHIGRPIGYVPRTGENDADLRRKNAEEVLGSQISLMSEAIRNNTESQAQKNSAINNFMKTFNVISESGQFSSWDFNRGSNLYDIIEIIENTGDIKNGDIQSLEYFNNTFMPTIMRYSGLKWGERNEYQDKNNEKSKKIFGYEGDNEIINYLKNKVEDFDPKRFSGVANFEARHQLGFANLIKERLILGDVANGKLNIPKMQDFIRDLESIDKENDINLNV